nr:hypothetical protein [uncultured Actinoplanes sp.]
MAERIYARDFGTVRPDKEVPGVVGRARWFAARAGNREQALTLDRLRRGVRHAEEMADPAALRAQAFAEAHALPRRPRSPSLLDEAGNAAPVREGAGHRQAGGTAVTAALDVGQVGVLVIPVDERTAAAVDLETAAVAEISDVRRPVLNETFAYWPQEQVLVGRIHTPGRYQVFALPKDPSLRATVETLARRWPDIEDELTARGGDADVADLVCRAAQLPGEHREQVAGLLGDLGPDDVVARPAVVKLWWDLFGRCSPWRSIGPVPDRTFGGIGRVAQIAVHPGNGDIVVAAAAGGGIWRTTNAGASWVPTMSRQPTLTMGAVAYAPSDPSIVYAASGEDGGGWDPAWPGAGVYRSNDGGTTWTLMTPVPSTRFSAIAVHPRRPDTVYVAGNRGLHKSVDGGLTWRANPGLQSLFDGHITDVVVGHEQLVIHPVAEDATVAPLPFNQERVYIGVNGDGVHRSTTAGEQSGFTPAFTRMDGPGRLPSGAAAGWTKLAIGRRGPHRSSFLAAKLGPDGSRIFTTVDGGGTWTELASGVATVGFDEWCSVIAVDPTDEDVLYAGAAGMLQRTTTGGAAAADWTPINAGIHSDQQDIAFDPRDPSRIYLANDGGVYRSADRGTTWALASGSLAITQLYDIDISEQDRDVVAGGAQDNGVYYRNAAGVWRHIPWGDGTQVAVDPTDPRIFYFSSQNGLPANLRRSVDGGASHQQVGQGGLSGGSPWVTIIKLDPTDPLADPAGNRVVFVCGTAELFRSADGGQHWQRVEDAAGTPFQSSGEISALEFAPGDPSVLYLATTSGAVYRAVGGGRNAGDWTRIDVPGSPLFPGSSVQAIGVNPHDANDVWLVFGGSGVSFTSRPDLITNPSGVSHLFRNTDATDVNGWTDASGRFPGLDLPDVPTGAVALAGFDPLVAYAGTDVGVFRTTDGGVTWAAYQDGLPRSPVTELRFNRRFNRLFAATMGRGVYARDV